MTSLQISVITPFVGKQVCRLVFEEVLTIATSWNHWLVTGCGLWSLPSHSAMRLSSSDRVPTMEVLPPSSAQAHIVNLRETLDSGPNIRPLTVFAF